MASLTDYLAIDPDDRRAATGPANSPYEEHPYLSSPEDSLLLTMIRRMIEKPLPPKVDMPKKDWRDDPNDMRNWEENENGYLVPPRRDGGKSSSLSPQDIIRMLK